MRQALNWKTGGLLAAFVIVVTVLLCGLADAGVRRGMLPAVQGSLDLGVLRLTTLVIDDPTCTRPIPAGSIAAMCSPRSLFTSDRFYSGWIETRRRVSGRTLSVFRRLFLIRMPG